jgi:subtilase family serine protease
VVKGEYFIDTDPGFGKGSNLVLTPGTDISNFHFTADLSTVPEGFHKISTRFQDAKGKWSLTRTRLFFNQAISSGAPLPNITAVEYFIDTDPGFGKGKKLTVTPANDIKNIQFEPDLTNIDFGNHTLYIRARDAQGKWSLTNQRPFKLEHPSGHFITVDSVSTALCADGEVDIPFTLNAAFDPNNIFTAQLSDAKGSFANPVKIGTLQGNQSGTIKAKLSQYTAAGTDYRVRIVSSLPADTSSINKAPISIRRKASVFTISGDTAVCVGNKSYKLDNTETDASLYKWSLDGGGALTAAGINATINWADAGTHTITAKYTGGCAGNDSIVKLPVNVVAEPLTGVFSGRLPVEGEANLSLPVTFSWLPIDLANAYDLYIWPGSGTKPATPTVANIRGINRSISDASLLQYEQTYKWQLVAKRACFQLSSSEQTFRLRKLPNLAVTTIKVPPTGFSEQMISISWDVTNKGAGNTLNQTWFDAVYLSADRVLNKQEDAFLGGMQNPVALTPGEGYTQTGTFKIPQGFNNKYYVIVVVNGYSQLLESDLTDNESASLATTNIQLTPPPDLEVVQVITPKFAFSGQPTKIVWKVANNGTGNTRVTSWNDQLFLAMDSSMNLANAIPLNAYNHNGALNPTESYSQSPQVLIPEGLSGRYYLMVKADVNNSVYEHSGDNNNLFISDSITLILTPPIDLEVTKLEVPAKVNAGEKPAFKWTVENKGGSSTENKMWSDRLFISKNPVFDRQTAINLGGEVNRTELEPGQFYAANVNLLIPDRIPAGDYYVYLSTDDGNSVYEASHENNNIRRSATSMQIGTPDLTISEVTVPVKDSTGTALHIKWIVKNSGNGILFSNTITDRVLLSSSPVYDPQQSTELTRISYLTGELIAGATIDREIDFLIPDTLTGDFYIYVHTDFKDLVREPGQEENNITRSGNAVKIVMRPWADLQVMDLTTGTNIMAGSRLPITYSAGNAGSIMADTTSWYDDVYISKKTVWDSASSIRLRDFVQRHLLKKDDQYNVNSSVEIPAQLEEGDYYLYVFADAGNKVFENTNEENNYKRSNAFHIVQYPPVDLAVTELDITPLNVRSGKSITVQWTVKNTGNTATAFNQWTDGLYLSADTNWNKATDIFVKDVLHKGALAPSSSYSDQQEFVIPDGLSGKYYVLLVADHNDQNRDTDKKNNRRLILKNNVDSAKIQVTLAPPADLAISVFNAPASMVAGQPVKISWQVTNTGNGTTAAASWTDKLYLSKDKIIDYYDHSLATGARKDSLKAGASYKDTVEIALPIDAQGNYYLLFKTDAFDKVYEHQAEDNNLAELPVSVIRPEKSDLIVTSVQAPDSAIAGSAITIKWTVKNTGAYPASGYLKEGIYLSEDTVKDNRDLLLTSVSGRISIVPGQESQQQVTTTLTSLAARKYYVLVYTDLQNNIFESNDSNNIAASARTLKVDVKSLAINSTTDTVLQHQSPIYYKVQVPDSLAKETLLFKLKSSVATGVNEIYLKYGGFPTRAVHDYAYSAPFSANQELLVPSLKKGTYYLMVYGTHATGNEQPITISDSIRHFEVRTVNTNQGGNTGSVTVKLSGSKFEPGMIVSLAGSVNIVASNIKYLDQASAYASFDLRGVALGKYDVVIKNAEGKEAKLLKGFEVVVGKDNIALTSIKHPAVARPAALVAMQLEFSNEGNVDIPLTTKSLISRFQAPLGFSAAELDSELTGLTITLLDNREPLNVLRPGAKGSISIYSKAVKRLRFTLIK